MIKYLQLFEATTAAVARSSSYRYYFIFIRLPADYDEIVLRIIIIISTASYSKEQKGILYYIRAISPRRSILLLSSSARIDLYNIFCGLNNVMAAAADDSAYSISI